MTCYKAFITGRNQTFHDEVVAGGGTQICQRELARAQFGKVGAYIWLVTFIQDTIKN